MKLVRTTWYKTIAHSYGVTTVKHDMQNPNTGQFGPVIVFVFVVFILMIIRVITV